MNCNPCNLRKFGRIRGLVFGSYGEWSEDVDTLVRMCTRQIAKNSWMEAGFRNQADARAIFTQHIFKKLAVLSLKSVADLIYDRREAIGSNDGGESRAHVSSHIQEMEASLIESAGIHAGIRGLGRYH